MEKWIPVLIQSGVGIFFAGVAVAQIRLIGRSLITIEAHNREDHKEFYEKFENHGERLAVVENTCHINHSPSNGKARAAHV